MSKENMTKKWKEIMAIAASGVAFISAFLPWVTVSLLGISSSANLLGVSDIAFLALIASLAGIGLGVADFLGVKNMQKISGIGQIVAGALILLVVITIFGNPAMALANPGIGMIFAIIAAIVMVVAGILRLIDKSAKK